MLCSKCGCSPAGSQATDEAARPPGLPDTAPPTTSGRPSDPTPGHHRPHQTHEADVLRVKGQGFHVAHTVLLLLRMLQTYQTFLHAVPLLAADTARRAVELIKASLLAVILKLCLHRLLPAMLVETYCQSAAGMPMLMGCCISHPNVSYIIIHSTAHCTCDLQHSYRA